MLARLAHVIARHRWKVIGGWLLLTLFGAFSASQVADRWTQSFSIPGYSAYEANQRTADAVRHRPAPARWSSSSARAAMPHRAPRSVQR